MCTFWTVHVVFHYKIAALAQRNVIVVVQCVLNIWYELHITYSVVCPYCTYIDMPTSHRWTDLFHSAASLHGRITAVQFDACNRH